MNARFLSPESMALFWNHVDKTGGCWIWIASTNPTGYGQVRRGKLNRAAHRISWVAHNGPVPDGLCVLHACDTPRCVNPSHLFLGTKADNTADMMRKGRNRFKSGEESGAARLTWQEIEGIRHARACGEGVRSIARRMGLDSGHVSKICRGVLWKAA